MFKKADQEALNALLRPVLLDNLLRLASSLRNSPPENLVLGGAGSSGRIAFIVAHKFRTALERVGITITHWIAGGMTALRRTVEGAEDKEHPNVAGLLVADPSAVFLGITSGLSAPCVAHALYAAHKGEQRTALIGNNPLERAKDTSIKTLTPFKFSMFDVVQRQARSLSFFDLTIQSGEEVLTGSSRLKGGTTAYVVLDVLFTAVTAPRDLGAEKLEDLVVNCIKSHAEAASPRIYQQAANLMEKMAETFCLGGNVYYVGEGKEGRMGVLDASEIPPTFGVLPTQVRGFIRNGWADITGGKPNDPATAAMDDSHPCSWKHFQEKVMPNLGSNDLVVYLGDGSNCEQLGKHKAREFIADAPGTPLAMKLLLNVATTGAFARTGKVWGNRMIDHVPSNEKLVERAVKTISDVLRCKPERAKALLVEALELLNPGEEVNFSELSNEALAKFGKAGSIPLAVLLGNSIGHEEALRIITSREAIAPYIQSFLR